MALVVNPRTLSAVAAAKGVALLCVSVLAAAQGLVDPMRPPPEFMPAVPGAPVLPTAVPAGAIGGGGQIIILSRDRNQVTIDGLTAKLGGKLGDARVERLTDSSVVTRNAGVVEELKLYNNVEKRLVAPAAERTPARKRKTKK